MLQIIKDVFRSMRLTYSVNSMFNKDKLSHNVPLYRKYGLNKKYYSSISAKDFEGIEAEDIAVDVGEFSRSPTFEKLDADDQQSLLHFPDNGYAILKGFFDLSQIQHVNSAVDQALQQGTAKFRYGDKKMMFSHRYIDAVAALADDDRLLDLLTIVLASKPCLFQSISFPRKGSEQSVHTDSIHLSTFPRAGMVGVWIAMEPVDSENGAIAYYPGSHKLPYITNRDYDNEGSKFLIGDKSYDVYEALAKRMIEESGLEKKLFNASPGDVLIWHSNLFHAGEPHVDVQRTRKSTVFHFLSDRCIRYHEITQRPIIL